MTVRMGSSSEPEEGDEFISDDDFSLASSDGPAPEEDDLVTRWADVDEDELHKEATQLALIGISTGNEDEKRTRTMSRDSQSREVMDPLGLGALDVRRGELVGPPPLPTC